MKILTEPHGYTLIFDSNKDLDEVVNLLTSTPKDGKPPYLLTFYTTDGVTTEFAETEQKKLKKAFKNGK